MITARRLLLTALMLAPIVGASATPPEAMFERVRQPLRLVDGRLREAGGQALRAAFHDAQFVFIGEDHGFAEVPAFSSAVFDELAPLGFSQLVVEAGPTATARVANIIGHPDADAGIKAFLAEYPFSLAFYNMREEFAFLQHAHSRAGAGFRLIGIDQELMGAARLVFASVSRAHPRDAATPLLRMLLDQEATAYRAAAASGNPTQLFMMTMPLEEVTQLHETLIRLHDPNGAALVQSLVASREIYETLTPSQNASNVARASLMKVSFASQSRRDGGGVPVKSLFKFGSNHAMKGLNLLNSREIGNYAAETAEAAGSRSVHILLVAVRGQQLRFAGVGRPMTTAPVDATGPGVSDIPFAKPLFERALLSPGEWSVFDFRQLRDDADRTPTLDPRLVRLIFGFDFAVVIPQGTPASEIR